MANHIVWMFLGILLTALIVCMCTSKTPHTDTKGSCCIEAICYHLTEKACVAAGGNYVSNSPCTSISCIKPPGQVQNVRGTIISENPYQNPIH